MASVSVTGADSVSVDSRNMVDFADGDFIHVTFPNDRAVVKRSKNGNTIYALNEMGGVAEVALRVLMGSSDDKYLNSRLLQMENDFAAFTLLTLSFTKRVGDGSGNVSSIIYQAANGVFKKRIEAKSNAEGDSEQSVAIYTLAFGNAPRSIQ